MKKVLFGFLAAALLLLAISELSRVERLESINFEAAAREKMQETAASFSLLFSEIDTLCAAVVAGLSAGSNPQMLARSLQKSGKSYFTDGFYIVPQGRGNVVHVTNGCGGFSVKNTGSARQEWFWQALKSGDKSWGGPVFSDGNSRVLYYHVAVSKHLHLIFLYSAQKIYQKLFESGLNRYGLVYMIDSSTHFIAHPLDENRSLLELGQAFHDNVLIGMSRDIINRRSTDKKYRHVNTVTKQLCNELLLDIDKTGWLLGLSVYDGVPLETSQYQQALRSGYIKIAIYCTLLFLLAAGLLKRKETKKTDYVKFILCPVALLAMMTAIVAVYNRYPQQDSRRAGASGLDVSGKSVFHKWDPQRIIDYNSLSGFISAYQQESVEQYNQPAQIIPTGVYIYSVAFLNSHRIQVTGIFWQKYLTAGSDYPEEMRQKYQYDSYKRKGISFPGSHINTIEQVDSMGARLENQPASLFRWNFDVELEQQLSYSLYPFGKNSISLVMFSNNLDDNTILTPDLESYKQTYPTDKPGLDNHFYIKGWDIAGSYYSYSTEYYLCNFGNADIYGINQFQEMAFNISISRKFIDILICKFVPLLVVLVLLFTILFVRVTSDGFNNIIGCSGLFFVLMLDHINLRESVLSEGIMYLEFCYFISYVLLLLITITSFDISQNGKSYNSWVDTVLKKYFWTIIFGAMAVVTVAFFY